jgi:23S rRNA pseudouridine2605 synthase
MGGYTETMRINKFVARATGLSRRAADRAVEENRVTVSGRPAEPGTEVTGNDEVALDGVILTAPDQEITVLFNKPAGYVCSRDGQGSPTVYDLLPPELGRLKTVGRLDKDSSGLLLLTTDGDLANELTHPRHSKEKVYEVALDRPLTPADKDRVEQGVKLEDGGSRLQITDLKGRSFTVIMSEGRNRQIRRTFAALGYKVAKLHRVRFGPYSLGGLKPGETTPVKSI